MDILVYLLAGLIIAAALQCCLTSLGLALGLTMLDWRPRSSAASPEAEKDAEGTLPITHLLGLGIALSLSLVLFGAALLATELSQIGPPRRGSIFGLLLWSVYWLLFLWLSSTTLISLADSILGTAVAGGRRLVAALGQTLSPPPPPPPADPPAEQHRSTRQALVAAVTEVAELRQRLPDLLAQQRHTLIADLEDRLGLATDQAAAVVGELAGPAPEGPPEPATADTAGGPLAALDLPSWQQLLRLVLEQLDFSDLDGESLWHQLRSQLAAPDPPPPDAADPPAPDTRPALMGSPQPGTSPRTIADFQPQLQQLEDKLTDYCRYTNLEVLTPAGLTTKIQSLRQDYGLPPATDAALEAAVDWQALEEVLSRRRGLDRARQQALVETFPVRQPPPAPGKPLESAYLRLRERLQAVDWSAVSLEDVKPEVLHQLQALELRGELDWQALASRLQLPPALQVELGEWLQEGWENIRQASSQWARQAGHQTREAIAEPLRDRLSQYLEMAEKTALQSEALTQTLTQSLQETLQTLAQAAAGSLPEPQQLQAGLASSLDMDALRRALDRRQDLLAADIEAILEDCQSAWQQALEQIDSWRQESSSEWAAAQDWLQTQTTLLDGVRQQVIGQMARAQQQLQDQAAAVGADLQRQADATRRQVAIAAWWLFLSLLGSAAAAATAGWLAARY